MDSYDADSVSAPAVKDTGKVAFRFCPEWFATQDLIYCLN